MERSLFADKVNDVLFTNEKKQEIFRSLSSFTTYRERRVGVGSLYVHSVVWLILITELRVLLLPRKYVNQISCHTGPKPFTNLYLIFLKPM